MTASVQLIGVYLVFASLIIPALSASVLEGRNRLVAAYGIGAVSFVLGVGVSALLDLPTGAVTVWSMALVGVLSGSLLRRVTGNRGS